MLGRRLRQTSSLDRRRDDVLSAKLSIVINTTINYQRIKYDVMTTKPVLWFRCWQLLCDMILGMT